MDTYYIDFYGWCEIKADSEEEAKDRFWDMVINHVWLTKSCYDIDTIEKQKNYPLEK